MVTGAATGTVNRIPVLLLPGDIRAPQRRTCSPTTRISADRRHFRQRLLQAGLPLLGPHLAAGATPECLTGSRKGHDGLLIIIRSGGR